MLNKYRRTKKYRLNMKKIYQKQSRKRKLFCELHPVCYKISLEKEIIKRKLRDLWIGEKFAGERRLEKFPNLVFEYSCRMIKQGPGIDPVLQLNKAENIRIAAATMNGLLIHPGETFSFWRRVGKLTRRKGYKNGRVIFGDKIVAGLGGGLCNLANTIHLLILHSPLTVEEFHSHSDALAPDSGKRIPFSSGTSVSYNQIDYRFRNNTTQTVQLFIWCEGEFLHAELRSEWEFPWFYEISEENHHFSKEGEKYYRISKIYQNIYERDSGQLIQKKLVLDNHSEVMFDYSLIPENLIR